MDTAKSPAILLHKNDGTQIKFEPSAQGLFKHELSNDVSSINQMWSMLHNMSTVAKKAVKYSKRAYKRAVLAQHLQNIIMRPAARKYKDVIIDYLSNSPMTEVLPNHCVDTVEDLLKKVIHLYKSRGFIVDSIFADHEIEPLCALQPNLNTTAANKHVPDIEPHICNGILATAQLQWHICNGTFTQSRKSQGAHTACCHFGTFQNFSVKIAGESM
jgi:hypothetical protein